MIGNQNVQCLITGKDKYKRLLGICYIGSKDINAAMVLSGNAMAYHYFSEKYADAEMAAKSTQKGIWQDSDFTEPYYYRHLQENTHAMCMII